MIDQKLVAAALEKVDTTNFERFAQAFYGAIQDREFVPLGGIHDGGAEGYDSTLALEPGVFADETGKMYLHAVNDFMQASKQQTVRRKVRDTVKRLREYGRTPKVVTLVTSETVADIDKEESLLSQELDCRVSIRDARYIEVHINSSQATIGAFHSYLEPSIEYLYRPGDSEIGKVSDQGVDRTLAVFLRQEVEARNPKTGLLSAITDSLILWSLRDTDPDKGVFLKREEILSTIENTLPSAKALIRGSLDHRLSQLIAKDAPDGRQIRHYRSEDKFCLPYETRKIVAAENADDDLIRHRVSCVFEDRISEAAGEQYDDLRSIIVEVCHTTLERVFEHQGIMLARFVHNSDLDDELYTNVAAIATSVVEGRNDDKTKKSDIRRLALHALRGTFYKSTEIERLYLGKLSRTYVLMLLLKNDFSVIEHFSKMSGNLNLYIGSDIIIRALSELYLDDDSQTTVNLLKILSEAGSTLILTEKTVEEVSTHIRAQMIEFENVYAATERFVKLDAVEYIDRLLIRSYFYARLSPIHGITQPRSWRNYIAGFCDFADTRNKRGYDELARYLMNRFSFVYETSKDMLAGIDPKEISLLSEDIQSVKQEGGYRKEQGEILAYNDAVQVLRVYNRRAKSGETSPGSPFGFQTWWLTQDQKVRRGAQRAVKEHNDKPFMLRPEFLLTYISLAPNQEQVRKSFRTIFPSALGVRLSSGIRTKVFKKVMRDASELAMMDDARAGAIVANLTERLKADHIRRFDTRW